jgi:hypothetical protein
MLVHVVPLWVRNYSPGQPNTRAENGYSADYSPGQPNTRAENG